VLTILDNKKMIVNERIWHKILRRERKREREKI
jgi:hypothetical protein